MSKFYKNWNLKTPRKKYKKRNLIVNRIKRKLRRKNDIH